MFFAQTNITNTTPTTPPSSETAPDDYPSLFLISMIFYILFPIILFFIWIRYHQGKLLIIIIGFAGFTGSILCEGLTLVLFNSIFGGANFFSRLCSIVFPGLFEETGRLICLKYFLTKFMDSKKTPISYGIGHAGVSFILIGVSLFFAENTEISTYGKFFLRFFEKISSLILSVALSIFVFKGVKENTMILYLMAIGLHDFASLFGTLYYMGVFENRATVAIIIFLISCGVGVAAYKLYQTIVDVNGEYSEFAPIGGNSNSNIDFNKQEVQNNNEIITSNFIK